MGKNDYAKRLQVRKQLESEIIQRWTAQLCLDVITIVLNDPEVMGKDTFGKERLQRIGKAFNRYYGECIIGLSPNVAASHVRAQVDQRLVQIWGPEFESWEERYYLWEDKGI